MNLKDMKKVHEDEKTATFKNSKGHSFVIAKSGLEKNHLEKLKALPLHAAEGDVLDPNAPHKSQEAVEGDATQNEKEAVDRQNAEEERDVQSLQDQESFDANKAAIDARALKQTSGQESQPITTESPSVPGLQGGAPASEINYSPPFETPAPSQPKDQPPSAPRPPSTPQEHLQSLNQETANFASDLDRGHIKPETMSDLFGKKDTLGKMGTLFGLMLSGAGSGLSGQPNALLGMMQKQIDNDLEAQKSSATNRQNLLKINIENQFNKARIGLTKADTDMARMNAKIAGVELTKNQIMLGFLKHQTDLVTNSPDGPQKTAALNTLGGMGQIVNKEALQNNARASSQMGPVNYDKLNQLEVQSELKIPGAKGMPTPSDIQSATKEATGLEEARALRTDFNQSFDALDKMYLAGKLSPHARDSYVQSLAGKLAKASAGRYNQQEATNQINSMIPQVGDWGGTREIRKENNNKFFDIQEAGTPTLNRFGLKNEYSPEPETMQKHGATYKKVEGGWQKVKKGE